MERALENHPAENYPLIILSTSLNNPCINNYIHGIYIRLSLWQRNSVLIL